ncbi:MAG: hypothetical protein HQL99_07100 [Magnetococcales bacterium]|nr:hypothetical protein [Magnetococcales bacterium]
MSRRALFGVIGVTLIAYVVGLVLFLPQERLKRWSYALIGDRITWKSFTIGWQGIRFDSVRLNPTAAPSQTGQAIDSIRLTPRILPFFSGRLGAGYELALEQARLSGEGLWNGREAKLEWQLRMDTLTPLASVWLGPLGAEVRGKGEGTGWLTVATQTPQAVESGEWETRLLGVTAFGAKIDPLTLTGRMKDRNLMEIIVSGKGEIALSGKLNLKITLPDPRASVVSGELQIQPVKPNLPGMAGQLLAKGQAVRLTLSGTLDNLQWRL